jgi:hypothetical protein
MKKIFKTWKKATYFEGGFELRNKNKNWASPIEFPTVFTAYGAGIKSGNWQSCTAINTPNYVIDNYFDTIGNEKHHKMYALWNYCKQLEVKTWYDVENDEKNVLEIIKLANYELGKLDTLA